MYMYISVVGCVSHPWLTPSGDHTYGAPLRVITMLRRRFAAPSVDHIDSKPLRVITMLRRRFAAPSGDHIDGKPLRMITAVDKKEKKKSRFLIWWKYFKRQSPMTNHRGCPHSKSRNNFIRFLDSLEKIIFRPWKKNSWFSDFYQRSNGQVPPDPVFTGLRNGRKMTNDRKKIRNCSPHHPEQETRLISHTSPW